jgi:membrane protein
LAYYTIFSLPALLTFTVLVAAMFVDRGAVTARLQGHLEEAMGKTGAEQLQSILAEVRMPGRGQWGWLLGTGILLVGATGAMGELQTALNRAWRVEADPKRGNRWAFLLKRLISLAMLLVVAALLLASLVASWALSEFNLWIEPNLPPWLSTHVVWGANTALSLTIVTLLVAAIFKFMPDARLSWTDVWAGALVTSLLFVAGKIALGQYLAVANPATAYGAAGSLALVLLWIYYSAQVLLLGAEFTRVLARRRGRHVAPEEGAKRAAAPPHAQEKEPA